MTTSIFIGKILTVSTNKGIFNAISNHKIGEFASIISALGNVNIHGMAKESKIRKFIEIMEVSGFTLTESVFCSKSTVTDKGQDVYNFSFNYSK